MGYQNRWTGLVVSVFVLLVFPSIGKATWAQGISQSPYRAPSVVRAGLDLAPSNPLGLPGTTGRLPSGSGTLNISSRMFDNVLPTIPGLEITYRGSFHYGEYWDKLFVEYVRPARFGNTTVYGEVHGILNDFWRVAPWSEDGRLDLSLGGGVRRRVGDSVVVGAHGFYDATLLNREWNSSGSLGGFLAAMLAGNDAMEMSLNWYGSSSDPLLTAPSFLGESGSWDAKATYYHELWNGGPDLRLSLTGYSSHQQMNPRLRGYATGVALASRDGKFRASYEFERDESLKNIHTIGLSMTIGFRLEKLLALESPIENPTPVFSSPRSLDYFQNVANGTERPLGKEQRAGCVFGCGCKEDSCPHCWAAVQSYWHEWRSKHGTWTCKGDCKKENNTGTVEGVKDPDLSFGDWIKKKIDSESKCDGCKHCLHAYSYRVCGNCTDYGGVFTYVKFQLKWAFDKECCNALYKY